MLSRKLLVALLFGAGVALGRPGLAEEATTTANPDMSADQIDQWIRSAPSPDIADDAPDGVTPGTTPAPRKVHGEVGLSVGTGGYRSGYVVSAMPVGETGLVTLAIGQSRGRFGGDWSSASLGAAFGGESLGTRVPCRGPGGWMAEASPADSPADAYGAGRSRFCGPRP